MAHKINPNEYIHFEADQVLTNDDLNQQFIYLDQQNRWTRNKVLGTGIVCGLDICHNAVNNSITITKGSGITSQGYLILFPETKIYTHYSVYNPVKQPHDIPFECSSAAGKKNIPFYKEYAAANEIATKLKGDPIYLLGKDTTPPNAAIPLPGSNAITLSKYAVVLFLELDENDMRSCTTESCNNKGNKIALKVLPLLVPVSILNCASPALKAKEIKLGRYNVPYKPLCGTYNLLEEFNKVVNSGVIREIADAYGYCFCTYGDYLQGCCTQDVGMKDVNMTDVRKADDCKKAYSDIINSKITTFLNGIWKEKDAIKIQYFYDYINDLILAYYEFRETASQAGLTQCTGDECSFPLHLVLGGADKNSCNYGKIPCRTYFTPTPILENKEAPIEKMRFLLRRMEIMIAAFAPPVIKSVKSIESLNGLIRITPSQYRDFPLSERCIPYYYDPNASDLFDKKAINYWWNYDKTIAGNENFNLGYNADSYNKDIPITDPLRYDIEKYNFFRIEGHIGQNYEEVLKVMLNQREHYNLPFDVVAIPAECLNTNDAVLPKCNFLDLDSELRLLVLELLINIILCFLSLKKFAGKYYDYDDAKSGDSPLLTASGTDFEAGKLKEALLTKFSNYKHGDFVKDFGLSDAVTEKYLKAVNTKGEFANPYAYGSGDPTRMPAAYLLNNPLFELLHSVDVLFHSLLNTGISDLSSAAFKTQYENINTQKVNYVNQLSSFTDGENKVSARAKKSTELSRDVPAFDDCCCDSLVALAAGILLVIEEYLKRLRYYQSQLTFLHYFKQHPGLEHKSGVPQGGTFVLVYDTEDREKEKKLSELDIYIEKVKSIKKDAAASTIVEMLDNYCKRIGSGGTTPTPDPARPISISIPLNVVIADFYVPYLCCSDCAPVAYILDDKPTANNPPPTVYNVIGGGGYCVDDTCCNGVSVCLSGSDPGISYLLFNSPAETTSPAPLGSAMLGTGYPIDFGLQTETGTYTIVATNIATGSKQDMSGSVAVTIEQAPTVFAITGGGAYYADGIGVHVGLSGFEEGGDGFTGVSYQLFYNGEPSGAGISGTGTGGTLDFGLQTKPGTYMAVATYKATGCTKNMTGMAVVMIIPSPSEGKK